MKIFNIAPNKKLYIGNNSKENWELLKIIKPWYIFLHLSKFPSCYGILELERDVFPGLLIIKQCAEIVLSETKYKNMYDIKIDFTKCENIKKGVFEGEIIYKSNHKVKSITI